MFLCCNDKIRTINFHNKTCNFAKKDYPKFQILRQKFVSTTKWALKINTLLFSTSFLGQNKNKENPARCKWHMAGQPTIAIVFSSSTSSVAAAIAPYKPTTRCTKFGPRWVPCLSLFFFSFFVCVSCSKFTAYCVIKKTPLQCYFLNYCGAI